MLIVLSPAKSLDFESPIPAVTPTQGLWLKEATALMKILRPMAPQQLAQLMDISDKLAVLNAGRNGAWALPFTPENARPAALAFDGDVYDGLAARQMSPADLEFAQCHLRILSGLYGLLRPLDLIQAYRLEMGTRLANRVGKDLYAFWGHKLAKALQQALQEQAQPVLVNLASEEYFKAVDTRHIRHPIIQPVFEDWKNGRYKIISFFAKRARGLMARYAVENRLNDVAELKSFNLDGYAYTAEASREDVWVFRRR